MKIRITNTRCFIDEWCPEPWDKMLVKAFTKKSPDAYWAQKRTPGWSGATNFISKKKGMFATGLLPLVLDWCKEQEIDVELDDRRDTVNPPAHQWDKKILPGIELRWYQDEAGKAAIENERGLIKIPTGAGKTEAIVALSKYYGLKTLVVVDRVNLAIQTRDRFKKYGLKSVGIVGDKFNDDTKDVTITTVQSSHKLTNKEDYELVIVDESHHSKAKTYIALLKELKNARHRFGFSGTVFGEDDVDDTYRISQFGPVIYELHTKDLIEEGVLAKPTIRMVEILKPNAGHLQYMDQYRLAICNNHHRNNIIGKFGNGFRGKVLILFKWIDHGQELRKRIPKAMYADGNTPTAIRKKIIDGFNTLPEGVLIASTILDEGIDFASIQHLIIAGGEKSIIKGIQRLGRGLRSDGSGKDTVNVIDFMDRTSNIMERHSKKRLKLYQQEGHEVKLFQLSEEEDDE